ncbi:unnamed protein product [Gongylonema pulchrum]|uniref:Cytochrome b5 heme-binding domain-containing protein n=1 Tax=Gongylonema pulchrum TaxID=637853 RepID=A0A3P7MYZ4_9BILA|nr:unnamed protein product [Gongylonema pulchrum]
MAPSETGRTRVVLRPGRSLMDWIRLTASRSTAARVKSGIDHVELSKHANVNDCWTLLGDQVYDVTEYLSFHPGGVDELMRAAGTDATELFNEYHAWVYDVTEYLSFHPGGVDELMRAAGTDATELFNEYHAWVNYETMLKTCLVGTFNGDRSLLRNAKPLGTGDEKAGSGKGVNFETAEIRASMSSDGQLRLHCAKWSELRDENVSLEFREKILRLLLHFSNGTSCSLHWTYMPETIFDGLSVTVRDDTIMLHIQQNNIIDTSILRRWTTGSYCANSAREYRNCEICEMHEITHDTRLFVLRMQPFCRLMVPVGHHVYLRICINGN